MSPKIVGLLLILFLLVSPAVRGQDVEILIFSNHEDEAVEKIVEVLRMGGLVKIEVDEELRDKKITVSFEHPVAEAIALVAKKAGGHLWKLNDGSFRISTKPQPGPGESTETAPAKKPDPAWVKEVKKRLGEVEVLTEFQGTPLPKILDDWARKAKVAIHLDPQIAATWKKEQFAVSVFGLKEEITLSLALTTVVGSVKLQRDFRWGGVFISTRERLKALPVDILPEVAPELLKTLRETKVDLKLKKATVAKAIDRVAKLAKVKISRDPKGLRKLPRVTIDVKDTSLEHLLALVLVPRGLRLVVGEENLEIAAGEKKK